MKSTENKIFVIVMNLVLIQGQNGRVCPPGTYLDCSLACSQTRSQALCSCALSMDAASATKTSAEVVGDAAVGKDLAKILAQSAITGSPNPISTGFSCDSACKDDKNSLTAFACYETGGCACLCGDNIDSACGCTENNGGTCVFCPAGTYSDNATNRFGVQCVPCASGKTSNLGSTSCSTCIRGTMNGTGVVNGTVEVIPCKEEAKARASRIVSSKRSYVVIYFVLAGFSMIRRMS